MHSGFIGADGETVFSPEFLRDYESAMRAVDESHSGEPLLQLLTKYKQAEEVAELEVSLGVIYGQKTGLVDPAKAIAHFSNALRYNLPERTRLGVLLWRGNALEQLKKHDAAVKDYLRGLLACSYHDLSGGWPETKRPNTSFDIRSDDDEDIQRARDYRMYQQRSDLQRYLLMQRSFFAEAVKRIRLRSSRGDKQLQEVLEELSPDTSRYALIMNLLKAETNSALVGPSPRGPDAASTPSSGNSDEPPDATTEKLIHQAIAATVNEPDPQVKARNSIVATVTGQLSTTWDSGKLYYASVKAGGTEIELDPAACPKVTRELLEFLNTQGGGLVSDIQVEAKGYLVFEKRPQTLRRREIARDDIDAVVPVLRVQIIKITTLPLGEDIGPIKRDRDAVKSTTVRTLDAEMPNQ